MLAERLERAIGVIYRPETELQSHYFYASLPRQFDEYIWFDETHAVEPLLKETGKGLLAADESTGTIAAAAQARNIVPGIKVDKGKIPLALSPGDLVTQGLDGLAERLRTYRQQGARFAKWREVYAIDKQAPTRHGIEANAEMLARYAAVCQEEGLVPIVEPEVLMDGDHDIARHAEVTEAVQHAVFHALNRHHVILELMILKPNMVLAGKDFRRAAPDEVAAATRSAGMAW